MWEGEEKDKGEKRSEEGEVGGGRGAGLVVIVKVVETALIGGRRNPSF